MIAGARLAVLLLIALGALVLGTRHRTAGNYVCPMHPEISAPAPGRCPICGMALGQQTAPTDQAARLLGHGAAPVHRRVLSASLEWPAWVDAGGGVTAAVFADEVHDLAGRGAFFAARAPDVAMAVERTDDAPTPWHGSMWHVRFRFRGEARQRAGATGWIVWPSAGRQSLVVLSSAVLQTAAGPRLLVSEPDRRGYRRQPIVTGRVVGGYTVVISGARERELAFGLNAFSLDADEQLRARGASAP